MKLWKHLLFMFTVAFVTPLYFRFNYTGVLGIDNQLVLESFILAVMVTVFYGLLCLGVGDDR